MIQNLLDEKGQEICAQSSKSKCSLSIHSLFQHRTPVAIAMFEKGTSDIFIHIFKREEIFCSEGSATILRATGYLLRIQIYSRRTIAAIPK